MTASLPPSSRPPAAMAPWTTAEVAEGLHCGWTTDPTNIADAERLVVAVRAEAPASARTVLDYGCGTGRLSAYFQAGYTGYDPASAMLAVARRAYPSARFADRLLPDERFDVVVSNSVVQYQPEDAWADVLRDIAGRARHVALIETYDTDCDEPVAIEGGSEAHVLCWPSKAYLAVLREFGCARRRVLAAGDRALTLYVVRKEEGT